MGQNLRARLQRIKESGRRKEEPVPGGASTESNPASFHSKLLTANSSFFEAGFQTLKRTTLLDIPLPLPPVLPQTLPILIPDIRLAEQAELAVNPQDLLFFDLETTGLSGGAGTVAFLAAFGRFVEVNRVYKLQIDQYLLLDYPGEGDFLEAALAEFSPHKLIVSYNGKSFDSQILKTRCLMNALAPPVYAHADLLHPARRLWKRVLPDCSQATIETEIFGLDRTGDVPGSLAPEIWFNFLKNNDFAPLLGICDHNLRDIRGLAAIFISLCHIAANPLTVMDTYRVDAEQLALRWRDAGQNALRRGDNFGDEARRLGEALLELAIERGAARVAYVSALDLIRQGKADEGRKRLLVLIAGDSQALAGEVKCLALRQLAIDAEWRLRDHKTALAYTEAALVLENIRESLRHELETRRERLLSKSNQGLGGE
ncbi:hypothetical protein AGMMS49579_14600 [Spirochaetia bacterium]|nr:hypothetical protein AGMMS49579_14600 [Spirochaetia bacterium]